MEPISLVVPEELVSALPEGSEDAVVAMDREITQYETYINDAIGSDEGEAAAAAADVLDRLTERWEEYDGYIVELRAWGQSSIYAEVWCDFQYALIQQLYDHEELADALDRERNARIVDDGIRLGDR
ncbi:hypothetical protein [Natronorarus salvus]|uniref:hypothetical protein n=1 Tax=Natronorarus salvus TaxID=3117733 RepID=UPI002F26A2DB